MSMQISSVTSMIASQTPVSRTNEAANQQARQAAVTSNETAASTTDAGSNTSVAESQQMSVTGVPYSAHVGAKTYETNVVQMMGEYAGSVPGLFGAATVGSTVERVEENLGNLISFFA